MTILVTGSAGFIGMHLVARLLDRGETVVGFDNRSDPGSAGLGHARADQNAGRAGYTDVQGDLVYPRALEKTVRAHQPTRVIHLAAHPGAGDALGAAHACHAANSTGFLHVLEACRKAGIEHLVYASSLAVYGTDTPLPFSERACANRPLSLFAATEKANESVAHSYAYRYGLPTTGLRFARVYGSWGPPDSEPFTTTMRLLTEEPVPRYEASRIAHDYLAIDDAVAAVLAVLDRPAGLDSGHDRTFASGEAVTPAPWRIFNVGSGVDVPYEDLVAALAKQLDCQPERVAAPWPADLQTVSRADCTSLQQTTGWQPETDLDTGLARFLAWFRDFHGDDF